jgi:ribosomal protein L3 glutamine methyltransferase
MEITLFAGSRQVCKACGAGNNAVSSSAGTMVMQNEQPATVGALIRWCAHAMDEAGLYYGHGTADSIDESASLVFHVMGLAHPSPGDPDPDADYALPVSARQFEHASDLLTVRIGRRMPLPYITGQAWFAGLEFFVDERVLIPRSPFAELIQAGFEPWLDRRSVRRIAEIGTGSGCIAIACALEFPHTEVVATDISPEALEVARINVARHRVEDRVSLVQADLFGDLSGRFDLIISNPPYVPSGELVDLPAEYHHEPGLALASGPDGLSSARRILQDAAQYLTDSGLLAIEVGTGWPDLEAAFPRLPFVWPELEHGGEGIGLIDARGLTVSL